MNKETNDLLKKCESADKVCPKKVGEPMQAFLEAISEALTQAHAIRLQYAYSFAQLEDKRFVPLDQKLGALEREGRKLIDQSIKVQGILREFQETRDRTNMEIT